MIVKGSSSNIKPIPAGVQPAVCVWLIDVGTQTPNNPQYKPSRKVRLGWELPYEEPIEIEGVKMPRTITAEYGASLGRKAKLRSVLEDWRGRAFTPEELAGFDLKKLIGVNCQINIIHVPGTKDPSKVYAKVQSVIPLGKGQAASKPSGSTIVFNIPETGDIIIPADLPEWIVEEIKKSEEYVARYSGGAAPAAPAAPDAPPADDGSEECPF